MFSSRKAIVKTDLVTLGVCRKDRETLTPTVGGVLLFSPSRLQYFPDSWIQVGCFSGTNKNEIVSNYKLTSYFPRAIEECINIIKNNMKIGIKIEDIQHEEVWEIPKVALREAIINAVVHTDYTIRGAPIRVSIFTDRVEIENSALLQWGLTLEDLRSGVSKLRNHVIGRVFYELGIIEQWGSGIRRMVTACVDAGLREPLFEEIGPRIRITFFKHKIKQVSLDPVDAQIMEFIKMNESASTQEIVVHTKISRRSVITKLSRLVDMGLLTEIALSPTDPKKRYRIS